MGSFDNIFSDVPAAKQEPSLQKLYDYQKFYMELVESHKEEIDFIEEKLKDLRSEQVAFFDTKLSEISKKLDEESIDTVSKTEWLKHLEENMQKSFEFSERLLNDFAIMKIDEFKNKAEKLVFERV
ncbi:MAG: hypothetical protein J6X67_02010 [Treponema sp.]|nr:hypothetical protein [Treponema sp.]